MGFTRRRFPRGGNISPNMFPFKKGVDYTQLRMTDEGRFSTTWRDDAKLLMKIIKDTVGDLSKLHITDLTGGTGADTITFGLNFKKVDSIEINPENFEVLKHNTEEVYKLDNVTLHQGDSTKLFNWRTDIIYVDAPWGGPSYKEKTHLDLFLGDQRLDEYLEKIYSGPKKPYYIFLKLPRNYNFDSLLGKFPNIQRWQVRKFYLFAIMPPI